MKTKSLFLSTLSLFVIFFFSHSLGHTQSNSPKNIILMISDGCGYNHVDAASYYEYGEKGLQVYEQFPVIYPMSTYSYEGEYDSKFAWNDFQYVRRKPTDSAAAITAMASGTKTINGMINTDINRNKTRSMADYFEEMGRSTGVVTTVPFCHATPAGFVAHHYKRSDYIIIADEMLTESMADVIIGAGHPYYDDDGILLESPDYRFIGKETWESVAKGKLGNNADLDDDIETWKLVTEKEEFERLMKGPTPERVFGLFKKHSTLQQKRRGYDESSPFAESFTRDIPQLYQLSLAAINVLDNNPEGFFLMIEGGAVDWASHSNQSDRMIEEQIDFNKAVNKVVEWIESNSSWEETLLIVTADHECGYLTGPLSGMNYCVEESTGKPQWNPVQNKGKGVLPEMEWHSKSHTNSLVPCYAKGKGSELLHRYADQNDPIRGNYIDNTELADVFFALYEISLIKENAH